MIAGPLQPDPLDDAFPLGDGTAASEGVVLCPHCGAENTIGLDPGGGSSQEYVEDCHVCCRAWRISVRYGPDGSAAVEVEPLDA